MAHYNIRADRVNVYEAGACQKFTVSPLASQLPALLRQDVDLNFIRHSPTATAALQASALTKSRIGETAQIEYHIVQIVFTSRQTTHVSSTTAAAAAAADAVIQDRKKAKKLKAKKRSTQSEGEETAISEASPPSLVKEDDMSVMVISKIDLCALQRRLYTGRYYCYLMTHDLQGKKTSAHVGYTTDPLYDVYLHNHSLINDRTTNAAAPYWRLDCVLGPFITLEKAILCSEDWVNGTRGQESKRNKACLLKVLYAVNLYTVSIPSALKFIDFLMEHAPTCHIETYQRLLLEHKNVLAP
jgi:hypothetical protein